MKNSIIKNSALSALASLAAIAPMKGSAMEMQVTGGYANMSHDLEVWTDEYDSISPNASAFGSVALTLPYDEKTDLHFAVGFGENSGNSTVEEGDEPYTAYFKCESDWSSAPACSMADKFSYKTFDAYASRKIESSNSADVSIIAGVRYAMLDFKRGENNIGFGGDMDDEYGDIHEHSEFSGLGPIVGASATMPMNNSVSLFGSVMGGVLFGDRKYSAEGENTYDGDYVDSRSSSSNESLGFAELEAGLSFNTSKSSQLSVGYSVRHYGGGAVEVGIPNENESLYNESLEDTPTDTSSVTHQGVFARFSVQFD